MLNYLKFGQVVQQRLFLENSGSFFVWWGGTFCETLVAGIVGILYEIILNLDQWFKKRCHLKIFYF